MSRSRHLYDPSNPQMLSEETISSLTPTECNVLSDQVDQNLVGVLQEIDQSLSKANLLLTLRILPAVQTFGESSQRIWESVKFWKMFFEASANTKLSEPYTGDETVHSESDPAINDTTLQPTDEEPPEDPFQSPSHDQSIEGTPRPPTSTTTRKESKDLLDPYSALQADLSREYVPTPPSIASSQSSLVSQTTRDLVKAAAAARASKGYGATGPDSPDLSIPEFETVTHLERLTSTITKEDKGKQRAYSPGSGVGSPRLRVGAERHHPALLEKLLRKQLASPSGGPASPIRRGTAPQASTPGTARIRRVQLSETDLPSAISDRKGWNGIADLSQTPLGSFFSPIKKQYTVPVPGSTSSTASTATIEHPSLLTLNLKTGLSQTPAREAVRRMARDVYESAGGDGEHRDSPGASPPSAMKEWTRRVSMMPLPRPSPSERGRRGFEEEEEEDEEGAFEVSPLKEALTEGTDGLGNIIDDDDGRTAVHGLVRAQQEGTDEYGTNPEEEGDSYILQEEGDSIEYVDTRDVEGRLDGPEDTLFGMQQRQGGRGGAGFRVMGLDEMDTLHGGVLLESEPFEASPLAARQR